jgi:single-strand DNA-binding protein
MYESYMTAVGTVLTQVNSRALLDGTIRASFRVACNERRRDRENDTWKDGDSLIMTVTCWRTLAENVAASLNVGDPVIVRGRAFTRQFEVDGRKSSVLEMEAYAVGPDLRRSRATVIRPRRAASEPAAEATQAPQRPAGVEHHEPSWSSGPLVDA